MSRNGPYEPDGVCKQSGQWVRLKVFVDSSLMSYV